MALGEGNCLGGFEEQLPGDSFWLEVEKVMKVLTMDEAGSVGGWQCGWERERQCLHAQREEVGPAHLIVVWPHVEAGLDAGVPEQVVVLSDKHTGVMELAAATRCYGGPTGAEAENGVEWFGAGHPGALDRALPVGDVPRAWISPAPFSHKAFDDRLRPPVQESRWRQVGGPGHQGGVREDVGHSHGYGDPSCDGDLLYIAVQVALQTHRETGVGSGPHAVTSRRPPVLTQVPAQEGIDQLQDCYVGDGATCQHGDAGELDGLCGLGAEAGPEGGHPPEKLLIVLGDPGPDCWLEQGDELLVRCGEGVSAHELDLFPVRVWPAASLMWSCQLMLPYMKSTGSETALPGETPRAGGWDSLKERVCSPDERTMSARTCSKDW